MSNGDLTPRVAALESDMAHLREEWIVVQQTPLVQGRLLNALRETQLEHSRVLEEHGRILGEHGRMLGEHERRFDQVDAKLELLGQGMAQITGMLTTLIERDDPR